MNQKIKTKWVAALRSGEYKQASGVLTDGVGFCCLGVLCELHEMETGFGIPETLEETGDVENIGSTIRAWSGLPRDYGDKVTINGVNDQLTCHNDNGQTFMRIADAIESQL